MPLTDYNKRKELSVDLVSGSPTVSKAQPLVVSGGDDSITGNGDIVIDFSNVAGPEDIAVYDQNNKLLNYEIESFDATNETAVLWAYNDWVRDGSTQAQVAYGSNSANEDRSQSGTGTNAWSDSDQGTLFAYHMNGNFNDSSPNGRDGSFTGTTDADLGVDGARDFDGDDDKANASYSSSYPASDSGTVVCHVEADQSIDSNPNNVLFENGERGNFDIRVGDVDNQGGYEFFVSDSDGNQSRVSSNITTQGQEFILVATHDGSTDTLEFYADGALQNSSSSNGFALDEVPTSLSVAFSEADGKNPRHLDCTITELKAFDNYKDSVWAEAEFDATPKAGQVFFSQQSGEPTADILNFNRKKKVDVDSVSGSPTVSKAQPIIISGGDDSTTGNGDVVIDFSNITDERDISVFDENGNLLDYEVQSFDTTNETAVLWVYNDWVRDGTTQAQIAYGSNQANTDHQNTTGTWNHNDQNTALVQHFEGDPIQATDSSSNNNDGNVNGVSSIDGEIGNVLKRRYCTMTLKSESQQV